MKIDVNGVSITLTKQQLEQIAQQTKKNRSVVERIQTLQDIYDELGINDSFLPYKNPTTKFEKYLNACAIIPKIVEVYNEDTTLDWKNSSQYKYLPYKYFSGGSWAVAVDDWSSHLFCSGFHFFKSKELAQDALNKFKNIYEDYWSI